MWHRVNATYNYAFEDGRVDKQRARSVGRWRRAVQRGR